MFWTIFHVSNVSHTFYLEAPGCDKAKKDVFFKSQKFPTISINPQYKFGWLTRCTLGLTSLTLRQSLMGPATRRPTPTTMNLRTICEPSSHTIEQTIGTSLGIFNGLYTSSWPTPRTLKTVSDSIRERLSWIYFILNLYLYLLVWLRLSKYHDLHVWCT